MNMHKLINVFLKETHFMKASKYDSKKIKCFIFLDIMSSGIVEDGGQIPSPCNMYVDLFSCASLRIGEDDWNSLVNSGILYNR